MRVCPNPMAIDLRAPYHNYCSSICEQADIPAQTSLNGICQYRCERGERYDDSQSACVACPFPCGECNRYYDCKVSCRGNRDQSTNCSCPNGLMDDFVSENCVICNIICLTCSGDPFYCTSCNTSLRSSITPECPCRIGEFTLGAAQCQRKLKHIHTKIDI